MDFCCVQMIYVHLLTLHYSLQCAKRINMLYESLVGHCEYTSQPKGFFWCHVIDTKGAILLVILLNKFALVLLHTHLDMWYS